MSQEVLAHLALYILNPMMLVIMRCKQNLLALQTLQKSSALTPLNNILVELLFDREMKAITTEEHIFMMSRIEIDLEAR